jgi:hypothetical protein
MYTISTMEAAIRPLGIVSNSSCGLLPFTNWIRTARDVDYRFGLIKSIRLCHRKYRAKKPRYRRYPYAPSFNDPMGVCEFLHVGLLNERGIENWLEIEISGTSSCVDIFGHNFFSFGLTLITNTQVPGIVAFSPTCEALVRGALKYANTLVIQKALSLVELAMRVEDAQVTRSAVVKIFPIYFFDP